MPDTRKITIGGESVFREAQMASGKIVRDEIGFRTIITAEWEYVPAKKTTDLHALLRGGGFFKVTYPDPALGDTTNVFSIEPPETRVFKFIKDTPMWAYITLVFTAQEVQ